MKSENCEAGVLAPVDHAFVEESHISEEEKLEGPIAFEIRDGGARRDLPERTFEFALRVVKLCQQLDREPGIGRTISNQLVRSGTSVGAQVEEGQASQSPADFVHKYSIACKEARETHYWLRLLRAASIIPADTIDPLIDEANQLIAILTTIIRKTKQQNRGDS